MKDSNSKKHLNFPTFEFSRRYTPQIPSQSTFDPHQDSSSNEEIQGVTQEETLYHIPNTKDYKFFHHTQAYLKTINQYPYISDPKIPCFSNKDLTLR